MNTRINKLINKYQIDLSGLTVLTEAASKAYRLNPFIAIGAGAKRVICKVKSTRYGTAESIMADTYDLAKRLNCLNRIIIKESLQENDFHQADIITNSGHLRPIKKDQIQCFKKTAVIPLMWETWEFHDGYLDLNACKEKGVLVLGTDESKPPCDMKYSISVMAIKLLLEAGVEIADNNIILLGSTHFCDSIKRVLLNLGAKVTWFSSNDQQGDCHYNLLASYLRKQAKEIDAILFAEHYYPHPVLGGLEADLSFVELFQLNHEIKIAISCGCIDKEELECSGLYYFPKKIAPFGYMSYQPHHVGSLPVQDLFAAGLKVGEAMARARLSGLDLHDATVYALKYSPAQDFTGQLSWRYGQLERSGSEI